MTTVRKPHTRYVLVDEGGAVIERFTKKAEYDEYVLALRRENNLDWQGGPIVRTRHPDARTLTLRPYKKTWVPHEHHD